MSQRRARPSRSVLSAVYFVLMWCSGMLGFFGPAFMFVGRTISLTLNGPVVMRTDAGAFAHVPARGMGGIVAPMVVTGHAW